MNNPTFRSTGLSLLGVCAGLLVMLAGFYFASPPVDRNAVIARLIDFARALYYPERDLQSYVAGCLAGMVLPAMLPRRTSKSHPHVVERIRPGGHWRARSTAMISLVALGVFFSACPVKYGASAADWIVLVLRQRLGLSVHTSADLASRLQVLVSAVLFVVLGLLAALQLGRIEIGGQPQEMASAVLDFQPVTSRLAALQRAAHKAAILDVHEPIDCLASRAPPCDRYRPLMYNLSFRDRLDQALK